MAKCTNFVRIFDIVIPGTRDWDCPIKAWLVNGCVIILLGVISLLVLTIVTNRLVYSLLFFLMSLRIYEIWVVFDFCETQDLLPSNHDVEKLQH
ncbi:hypothetical protein Ocin01_15055 [Orchesella cincta]|uniref:Uncharacterized protein n=1 Tax=Orchesella cincta TaxID=48709 RepID=A0A1D2MFI0_ORCCI|nr:hypothetical protein Ocin01_15055 [Orchesella cincta]